MLLVDLEQARVLFHQLLHFVAQHLDLVVELSLHPVLLDLVRGDRVLKVHLNL